MKRLGIACGSLLIATIAVDGQTAPPAQNPPFLVAATWSDIAPASVTFDESGQPFVLRRSDTQARFEASIPRGPIGQRRRGTLRAAYADGANVVVPVRLVESKPELNITFLRAATLMCRTEVVERLERSSQDFHVTLTAYFEARELSLRSGACGSWAKERVRKAWVDRSYNLAVRSAQILFDEDAAEALILIAPARKPYVDRLRAEAETVRLRLLTDQKLAAIGEGDYDTASVLNDTLLKEVDVALESNDLAASPGKKAIRGLSIDQLQRDGAFIQSLSASQ